MTPAVSGEATQMQAFSHPGETLGGRLLHSRERLGLTRAQVAFFLGIPQARVSTCEEGQSGIEEDLR